MLTKLGGGEGDRIDPKFINEDNTGGRNRIDPFFQENLVLLLHFSALNCTCLQDMNEKKNE